MPQSIDPPVPDAIIDTLRDLVAPEYLTHDPLPIQVRAGALFARLKALNRAANAASRATKQVTFDARYDMDQTHFALENLLYEKKHLEHEIDKCRQFASIYQDIPLYSLEEFAELAPEEAKSPEVFANAHQLMLNRLSFELAERQRLDLRKKELTKQKEDLIRENKIKLATTESVKMQIDTLMKTATEVRKKVGDLVQPITAADSTPAPS